MAEKRKGEGKWSARSQRALIEEYELRTESAKWQRLIAATESAILGLDKRCTELAHASATLGPLIESRLSTALGELEAKKRCLLTYKEQAATLESKIEKVSQPAPSEAAARKRGQEALARLARTRLVKDQDVAEAVKVLKGLLAARLELTAKMRELSAGIDFTWEANDGLDSVRFEALRDSLPSELAEESSRWLHWFLGGAQAGTEFAIESDFETLPETLAAAHCYRRGDRVKLSDEQAERLLLKRPDQHRMTTEEFAERASSGHLEEPPLTEEKAGEAWHQANGESGESADEVN